MKTLFCILTIILTLPSIGCSLNGSENEKVSDSQSLSLITEYDGVQWGDSLDDGCGKLDGNFGYEVKHFKDELDCIYITSDKEFKGLSVEKILHFTPIDANDRTPVLVDISYAFEKHEDIYALLVRHLGEPDNPSGSGNSTFWYLSKVSELFSEDEIESVYGSLEFDTSEDLANETAESYALYDFDGKGYLIDDGSYIAVVKNKLKSQTTQ